MSWAMRTTDSGGRDLVNSHGYERGISSIASSPNVGVSLTSEAGRGPMLLTLRGRVMTSPLVDPVPRHVDAATARSASQPLAPYRVELAEARHLPLADGSVDAVLLMGPLYHLVERDEQLAALREVTRVLRPGGRLIAEIITRYAGVLDAARRGVLAEPGTWEDLDRVLMTGRRHETAKFTDGSFWGYLHRPDELMAELELAGFGDIQLVAVEGFAWLLGDLQQRMRDPADLLRAIRLTESEPSMLGASSHVIGAARLC
jgi:SAM-dependent methyltransferase